VNGITSDAAVVVEGDKDLFLLDVSWISNGDRVVRAGERSDFHLEVRGEGPAGLTLLGHRALEISFDEGRAPVRAEPGSDILVQL
jgi:hypothetical protein